eukprot:scaffold197909_cov33-Tisochrysis_lutea.AAC.2
MSESLTEAIALAIFSSASFSISFIFSADMESASEAMTYDSRSAILTQGGMQAMRKWHTSQKRLETSSIFTLGDDCNATLLFCAVRKAAELAIISFFSLSVSLYSRPSYMVFSRRSSNFTLFMISCTRVPSTVYLQSFGSVGPNMEVYL